MSYRAVLFDIGGVVFDSPFVAIYRYEEQLGLPKHTINKHIAKSGDKGAWAELEKGNITRKEFCPLFQKEMLDAGYEIDGVEFMEKVAESLKPRKWMFQMIKKIRKAGFKTCAITNNWIDEGDTNVGNNLVTLFDHVVQSALEHVRKPEKRIYEIALEKLGVEATDCIYLDDIPSNLKAPKEMGMKTILVPLEDPKGCVRELEALLNIPLSSKKAKL